MARSRSSRASTPSRRPAPSKTKAPAPTTHSSAPATATNSAPASGGGFMSTIAEGFAFGTGSSIARHGVEAVSNAFGGSKGEEQPAAQPEASASKSAASSSAPNAKAACDTDGKAFLECLDRNTHDVGACQFYLDALNQCKQQSMHL